MEKKSFVLKGNIVYSGENKELCSIEGGYVVCENGICRGAFEKLPKQYETLPLTDYGDKIILPGMTDLHVHAPQYTFRAHGMDFELLDWLNVHTFPEEAKYVDISYAKRAYGSFVSDLKHSLTTRACIFATPSHCSMATGSFGSVIVLFVRTTSSIRSAATPALGIMIDIIVSIRNAITIIIV